MSGFKSREFENLNDLLAKNEHLETAFFQTVVQMSKLHLDIVRNSTTQGTVHKMMNKQAPMLNTLCDEDKPPTMSKINVQIREF